MPPKKVFFKYKEEDVYKALDELQSGCKIRETCRKYNIPHSTIINKIKMRWPTESPLKKDGKRKFTKKRLPDAVTSVQWMKYWGEKKKEQEEKESKKLARQEKKKLQELKKSEKPKAKRIKRRAEEAIEPDLDEDDVPLVSYRTKTRSEDDKIELGSYVIVKYEGEYFPGIVKNIDKQDKEVSTMVLSGSNTTFKWPDKEDTIWYANDKIVEKINAPVSINNRGSFKVVEMAKYFNWI